MATTVERSAFYHVLAEAIADLLEHGFDSQQRLERWLQKIETTARAALIPEEVLDRTLRESLTAIFQRLLTGDALKRRHTGIDHFTLEAIKPRLRLELDRRILASANLIHLNREASIARTLQRFSGWATSIPAGGADVSQRLDVQKRVRRGIAGLPFAERRVIIDQGHKLVAAIDDIVATDGGAIGGVWHSRWREAGYDYREDHKERDGIVYVIRGNWAMKRGFMKLAGTKYTDQITQVGQEPFCRCTMEYLYTLRDLPKRMLTKKGEQALTQARTAIASFQTAYATL